MLSVLKDGKKIIKLINGNEAQNISGNIFKITLSHNQYNIDSYNRCRKIYTKMK